MLVSCLSVCVSVCACELRECVSEYVLVCCM